MFCYYRDLVLWVLREKKGSCEARDASSVYMLVKMDKWKVASHIPDDDNVRHFAILNRVQ